MLFAPPIFYVNNKITTMMPPIRMARIINPITAGIALRISGRNFESNITTPIIHKTTSRAIKSPPTFYYYKHII